MDQPLNQILESSHARLLDPVTAPHFSSRDPQEPRRLPGRLIRVPGVNTSLKGIPLKEGLYAMLSTKATLILIRVTPLCEERSRGCFEAEEQLGKVGGMCSQEASVRPR